MTSPIHIEGGRVVTLDPARPRARSLTIAGGRVVALDGPAPASATVFDLAGRVAIPGLIDAHMHLVEGGEQLRHLDLSVDGRDAFEEAVAARHESLPDDAWLLGVGWNETRWGGERPDRSWLDACGARPAVCWRADLHVVLVNDAVLDRIDTSTDPPGGTIVRDASGAPSGLLVEAAAWRLVNPIVPKPGDEERRDALRAARRACVEHGLTTVGSMEYMRIVRDVIEPLRGEPGPRCRVTMLDRGWPLDVSPARDFDDDDRLAVIGCKAFIDGTLGSRTARMLAPYADAPGERGTLVELALDGHLEDWARGVLDAGLSPAMHAIGDEAVRMALDVHDATGRSERLRIEHGQQIDPSDVERCADTWVSMQPLHKADDARCLEQRLGRARLEGSFAFRVLLDAGARLAFGTDWPVVPPDPIDTMRVAITGVDSSGAVFLPEHNVTPLEALRASTVDAAQCLGMDDTGVLRIGAAGDVTVLDMDPLECDWYSRKPCASATIVGGEVLFDGYRMSRS